MQALIVALFALLSVAVAFNSGKSLFDLFVPVKGEIAVLTSPRGNEKPYDFSLALVLNMAYFECLCLWSCYLTFTPTALPLIVVIFLLFRIT